MRDRKDFIENLETVRTHLLILTEDIKYPLSNERQEWLDAANLLIGMLVHAEMKDDMLAAMKKIADQQVAEGENHESNRDCPESRSARTSRAPNGTASDNGDT